MITFRRDFYRPSGKPTQAFSALMQKARSLVWEEPCTPRKALKLGVLRQVRNHTFTLYSDRDLKDTLDSVKQNSQRHVSDDILPIGFALVIESIDRRLGAWRIFESSIDEQGLEVYQKVATQVCVHLITKP